MASTDLRVRTIIEFLIQGAGIKLATEQLKIFETESKLTEKQLARLEDQARKDNAVFDAVAQLGFKPLSREAQAVQAKIDLLNEAQKRGIRTDLDYNAAFKQLRVELAAAGGAAQATTGKFAGIAQSLSGLGGIAGQAASAIASIATATGPLAVVVAAFIALKQAAHEALDVLKEAGDAEDSQRKLAFVLENLGVTFGGTGKALNEYFANVQDLTRFSDEEARDAFRNLAQTLGDPQEAITLLARAIDIASISGAKLSEVTQALGLAVKGGATKGLRGFGIVLSANEAELFKNANEAERLNIILEKTADREGAAAAISGTLNDELAKLNNQWKELKENIGALALPEVTEALGGVVQVVKDLRGTLETIKAIGGIDIPITGLDALGPIMEFLKLYKSFRKDAEKPLPPPQIEGIDPLIKQAEDVTGVMTRLGQSKEIREATEQIRILEKAIIDLPLGVDRFGDALAAAKTKLAGLIELPSKERGAQALAQALESGTTARLAAEKQVLAIQEQRELSSVVSTSQEAEAIREKFRITRASNEQQFSRAVMEADKASTTAALHAELQATEQGSEERFQLEDRIQVRLHDIAVVEAQKRGQDTAAIDRIFDAQAIQRANDRAKAAADAERGQQEAVIQEKIAPLSTDSTERLALELQLLKLQEVAAIESAKRTGSSVLAVYKLYEQKRLTVAVGTAQAQADAELQSSLQSIDAEIAAQQTLTDIKEEAAKRNVLASIEAERELGAIVLSMEIEKLDEQEKAEMETAQRRFSNKLIAEEDFQKQLAAIRKKYTEAGTKLIGQASVKEVQWAEQSKDAKVQTALQTSSAVIGATEAAFGRNKATAIATVIIDTIQAAMKAIAELGPIAGPIVAGIFTALGAVQIAKIASTNIGSGSAGGGTQPQHNPSRGHGFDDQAHDAMAKMGGRRWAEDWVRLTGQGFRERLQETIRVASPVTNNTNETNSYSYDQRQESTTEVHVHGNVYGGERGMRQLHRKLAQASDRDSPRKFR